METLKASSKHEPHFVNPRVDDLAWFYAKGELDEAFKVSIEQVYREAFCEMKTHSS